MEFDQIRVINLFGEESHEIPLTGKPFFLVGPNGSGKTTLLKAVFFACTGQWDRLHTLPIDGIEFAGPERRIGLERSDFPLLLRIDRLLQSTSRRQNKNRPRWPVRWEDANNALKRSRIASRFSPSLLEQIENEYHLLAQIQNFVYSNTRDRFLYFPTYRRVERDLKELISDESEDLFDLESGSELSHQIENRYEKYGEVIGFGGQDIEALIAQTAEEIRQEARLALNDHSIGFLDALVTADLSKTRNFRRYITRGDNAEILLTRIRQFAPTQLQIEPIEAEVSRLVAKLQGSPWGRLRQKEDMLLYYLSELYDLVQKVDEYSKPLLLLVSRLNSYLGPKKSARMDSANNIKIYHASSEEPISFDDLSSGEKQIVAFLAFLILNKNGQSLFVLLDEPELSLSVSWQKTLIADMFSTGKCACIVSATHSPFIIEGYDFAQINNLGD